MPRLLPRRQGRKKICNDGYNVPPVAESQAKLRSLVSVIIPVYNDAERLKLCLDALARQTYPGDRYEVIVVDNGSQQDPELVTSRYEQVTLAHEACRGSYAARNTGLALARGDVLAFTNSDCIPAADWIEHGVARLGA